jgi:protein-disulfide isomerase
MRTYLHAQLKTPVTRTDHAQGPEDAPITLVEYGDYQCPYCGRAYPIVKRLQKALGANLRFVFRNFPMSQIHPDALEAAKVAEAASLQGKFWDLHDALYEDQDNLHLDGLLFKAEDAGLHLDRLNKDWASAAVEERISNDFESGLRSGVNGTPTFFVNGERYDGDWSYGPFLEYLQGLLQA